MHTRIYIQDYTIERTTYKSRKTGGVRRLSVTFLKRSVLLTRIQEGGQRKGYKHNEFVVETWYARARIREKLRRSFN